MHRWLAQTTQMAPFIHDTIMAALRTSAAGMVQSCNSDGTCGFRWNTGALRRHDGRRPADERYGRTH